VQTFEPKIMNFGQKFFQNSDILTKISKKYYSSDLGRVLGLQKQFFEKKMKLANFTSKYGFWPKSGQKKFFSIFFFEN
jgi:hypothetical protein